MVETAVKKPNLRSRLFYGVLAPYYEKFVLSSRRYKEALTKFIDALYIEGDKRILEAGCGTGIVSFALSKKPKVKVVAFDMSRKMLETAQEIHIDKVGIDYLVFSRRDRYHISFCLGDIRNPKKLEGLDGRVLTLEEESFDYVVVSGAFKIFKT